MSAVIEMEFLQATRYIFPLFSIFAILPFSISGPPGERHIRKMRKCFIFGNMFLTCALCFLTTQLIENATAAIQLEEFVTLFCLLLFALAIFTETLTSLRYQHNYIQFYHELIQICDRHPKCSKYFTTIFYFFIFKLLYFILNLFFEMRIYFSTYYNNNIIEGFFYVPTEFYQFVFISQYHLILISTICVFKSLNENLLSKCEIHYIDLFNQILNLFNKIISIGEINLLILIFMLFFWIVTASFTFMRTLLNSWDDKFTPDIYFMLDIFNYFFQNLIVTWLLIEQLKNEVNYLSVYLFYITTNTSYRYY